MIIVCLVGEFTIKLKIVQMLIQPMIRVNQYLFSLAKITSH